MNAASDPTVSKGLYEWAEMISTKPLPLRETSEWLPEPSVMG